METGDAEGAAIQPCCVRWLLDALFELDVLIPEWVALEVETYKVGAALKETILSV
jgi:hypothetical protein